MERAEMIERIIYLLEQLEIIPLPLLQEDQEACGTDRQT